MLEKNREFLEKYLREKSNRGYTERTIKTYHITIKIFLDFLGSKDVLKIDREDIEKYLEYLRKRKNSHKFNEVCRIKLYTVKYYLKIASLFLEWLEENDLILKNPARKIVKEIRAEKTKRKALSLEDVRKLVKNALNPRDKAIILTMAIAGLRRSEISNLKVEDVNLKTFEIFVRLGKGKKDRVAVMDMELAEALKVWLMYRKSMNPKTDALFCDLNGIGPLAPNTIYYIVKEIGIKAGVKDAYPHKLRHSAATFMHDSGMDLLDIKEQLGHADVKTTEGYIDVSQSKRKHEINKMPSLMVLTSDS